MAAFTGNRSTGNILAAQRKVDMASKILLLEPKSYPLTVLTRMLNKTKVVNPEFSWIEDDLQPRFDAINNGAGYASGATSIVVDTGTRFAANYLVKVTRTGEVMRVTAVATNTLTVVRGIGGGAAAINDNDELLVVGIAQPEGDDLRAVRSSNGTKVTNYTQIFREPFGATETHRHSDQFTEPNDWEYQASKSGIEHAKDIELALWYGKPSEDLSDTSKPLRTTGGVKHFANTNITDAGGTLTETEFFAALRPAFRYASQERVAFGSMLAVDVLNSFPRGKLDLIQSDNDKTYGLDVRKYVSPHGTVRLVTHPLFEGGVYGGEIAVLDMSQLAYRFLANEHGSRDTHIVDNRQSPGADARIDEYLTEAGLQCGQAKTHAWITNITG